jgi:hypothetical protein
MCRAAQRINIEVRSGPPDVRNRGFIMQEIGFIHARQHRASVVTIGTLLVAAASALMLMLLTGCDATPAPSGFVSTPADKATEVRLRQRDTMPPLQPFDEQFVAAPPADAQ